MIETVKNLVAELPVPLIAFAGAPFTVASYLIEGKPSRTYGLVKTLMLTDEPLWFRLMDRLADLAIASLRSQVGAGASAVQLFDSWAGALSPSQYERYVQPASRKVFDAVRDDTHYRAVVVVTHDPRLERFADRVAQSESRVEAPARPAEDGQTLRSAREQRIDAGRLEADGI